MQSNKRGSIVSSWWMTVDRYMLAAIGITVIFSMIMVTTASPAVAERIGLPSFYFIFYVTKTRLIICCFSVKRRIY